MDQHDRNTTAPEREGWRDPMSADAVDAHLPSVTNQSPLSESVEVWWKGKARATVRRRLEQKLEGSDESERGVAVRCFQRRETEVVVKTEQEYRALVAELADVQSLAFWVIEMNNPDGARAVHRVLSELRDRPACPDGIEPSTDKTTGERQTTNE